MHTHRYEPGSSRRMGVGVEWECDGREGTGPVPSNCRGQTYTVAGNTSGSKQFWYIICRTRSRVDSGTDFRTRGENATSSTPPGEGSRVTDDRELGGRHVVGFVATLIAVTVAFGALLGYVLPAWIGLEEIAILEMAVPVSPVTFGLYGGVTIGVFLVTLLVVLQVITRFDENVM